MKLDGKLDPGSGAPYQVLGRKIASENFIGNQTFTPISMICNLAVLTPGMNPPHPRPQPSEVKYVGGNTQLSIISVIPTPSGGINALAGKPYFLLRSDFEAACARSGIRVPAGTMPYQFFLDACTNRLPDCSRITSLLQAEQAAQTRSDPAGKGGFPGVPPGTYYLFIATRNNHQLLFWGQKVDLKAGTNALSLDLNSVLKGT